MKRERLRALNRAYADVDSCPGVLCGGCEPYEGAPERPYFGALCKNQRCELFDVREKPELVGCDRDADCRLRQGLGCCEGCGNDGPWIALNEKAQSTNQLASLVCDVPATCATCDSVPPDDLEPRCIEGRCVVSRTGP